MGSAALDLEIFVREALSRGNSRNSISEVLRAAGWPPEQVQSVLGVYADTDFPVPVPKPRPYLSAREAFFYLVLFVALYLSAYYLGALFFELIDRIWPDPATDMMWRSPDSAIRWSIASVVIAFPVFLFVSRYLNQEITQNPVKRLSSVRRWLTYLTLFVAAGFVIGDLITLVYNALGGELSLRFFSKVIVVGAIAGTIFGYYMWDLRKDERET